MDLPITPPRSKRKCIRDNGSKQQKLWTDIGDIRESRGLEAGRGGPLTEIGT